MSGTTRRSFARIHLVALIAAMLCSAANALPTTVFVYNHNPGDVFEDNAEGFIWQQLGLLDAHGAPISPIPESQIIRDGANNIIGYRSFDGTKEAYNVNSSATTAQAWQRVAAGGELHIIKHGLHTTDGAGAPLEGGGLQLDGGEPYDGFGAGTGMGYARSDGTGGPYSLPARPGADITINANGCYTSHDPDADGTRTSVTDSAAGVDGVGSTQGHDGMVYTKCYFGLQGGTPAQQTAALEALRAAARAAGFPPAPTDGSPRGATTNDDIGNWINSLPFATRHATVQATIDAVVQPVGTVTVNLTYSKSETAPGGGGGGFHMCPLQLSELVDGTVTYVYAEQFQALTVDVEIGDLVMPASFLVDALGELPAAPPATDQLASGVFDVGTINGDPLQADVDITFGYYGNPNAVEVLRYDPNAGAWTAPLGTVIIDSTAHVVTISTTTMGVYAVFAPAAGIPAVSTWGLVVMTLCALVAGTILLGRRRPSAA